MPPKPLDLGIISFEKKGDATQHFRKILYGYRPLDKVNAEDSKQLAELLKRHPEYEEKIGVGLQHFEIENADYGTRCFVIVRTDGSRARFSFPECIIGRRS